MCNSYYHLLCNLWSLLLNRRFFVHGYVMLCKSVCVSVTTWFLCTLPMFMYMVTLYQML